MKLLFDDLAPLYKDIPGGYTRIMPLGNRKGDGADMVLMEMTKKTVKEEDLSVVPGKKAPKAKKTKTKTKTDPQTAKKTKDKKKEEQGEESKKTQIAAPDITMAEKDEHFVEDVRKEKAKREQKKMSQKGIFKRFRRKSIG